MIRKRIVDTIQDPVRLTLSDQTGHRRQTEHAARRDPQILVPDLPQTPFQLVPEPRPLGLRDANDTVELEGQHFTHVADDELEFWVTVKDARREESEHVHRTFRMPAEAMQGEVLGDEVRVVAFEEELHRLSVVARVQVDGDVKGLGRGEDRPEEFVVVEAAAEVVVDQRADKVVFFDTAAEFLGGLRWRAHGEGGEAGEPGGMGTNGGREFLVSSAARVEV